MSCSKRVAFQLFAAKTLPTDVEDGCRIEETVERAEQRVGFTEDLTPVRGILVAREDHVERALLVVAAVNHVEEQARVRLVELTVADFVYYQAGGSDQACQERPFLSCPPGDGELVAELGRLYEVCLHAVAAALVAERLGKVRLSSARRANERDVPVRVYGSQRPQTFELVNLPAFEDIKVEVVECLELLLRQAAGAKEHLDG